MDDSCKIIDSHVHVFDRRQPLAAQRRYAPEYEALPENLLDLMDKTGVQKAVLVQPSFLGTNNSYIIDTITRHPRRFAGVAVVDIDTKTRELLDLRNAGIRGVRLNCIGKVAPDFSSLAYGRFMETISTAGLHIQIQAEGDQWLTITRSLAKPSCTIVIDHFGRTPPRTLGFGALMEMAQASDKTWFKFSAPYRFSDSAECAEVIAKTIGLDRVVWGSDWPWTQWEGQHSYSDTLRWLHTLIPDDAARKKVLVDNAMALYSFN